MPQPATLSLTHLLTKAELDLNLSPLGPDGEPILKKARTSGGGGDTTDRRGPANNDDDGEEGKRLAWW